MEAVSDRRAIKSRTPPTPIIPFESITEKPIIKSLEKLEGDGRPSLILLELMPHIYPGLPIVRPAFCSLLFGDIETSESVDLPNSRFGIAVGGL